MSASEILQIALGISAFARELMSKIPTDQLTEDDIQKLRDEKEKANQAWAALAPRSG
jgi:hypothetical protein